MRFGIGNSRAGQQVPDQLPPGVSMPGIGDRIVVLPRSWLGRGQRRRCDPNATLPEPNCEEVKVQLDQGLTGVERDDGRDGVIMTPLPQQCAAGVYSI